jgi:hypothetical protein
VKPHDITLERNRLYVEVFTSPAGAKVLEDLIAVFAPERLEGKTEHETVCRALKSEPIRYINRRIKDGLERDVI